MDLMLYQFFLHVLKVHAPNALLILLQRGMDNLIAIVFQTKGEANIGGRMKQHFISLGTQHIQCRNHTA